MKNLLILAAALLCLKSYGQNHVTAAEYFFGEDPGFGQAEALPVTPGGYIDQTFSIPTEGLTEGMHNLTLRVRDAQQKWSINLKKRIVVTSQNDANLISGEYFFNEDPGFGNGESFILPSGPNVDMDLGIPVTELDPGYHKLMLRFKNSEDRWSLVVKRGVVVIPVNNRLISAAEYFIDEDPGVGQGTPIEVEPEEVLSQTVTAMIPDTLSTGVHVLYLRVKSSDEKWSLYTRTTFSAQPVSVEDPALLGLGLYPNPFKDRIAIESGEVQITRIRILDMNGKCVLDLDRPPGELNVGHLAPGAYLLQAHSDRGSISKKIIKH